MLGIALLIVEAKFWIDAADFPEKAQLYPKVLLVCAFVLTVTMMVKGWRKHQKQENKAPFELNIKIVGMSAITVGYLLSMYVIGYLLSTVIFGIVAMAYIGVRKLPVLIGVSVITGVILYQLFNNVLYVPLPTGFLMDMLGF